MYKVNSWVANKLSYPMVITTPQLSGQQAIGERKEIRVQHQGEPQTCNAQGP